jgi:hypothetical protein
MTGETMSETRPTEFEKAAKALPRPGFAVEWLSFAKTNRKWWMLPIVLTLLALGVFLLLAGTAVAPFIYTLF